VGCSSAVLSWSARLWQLDGVPNVAVLPNTANVSRVRALVDGEPPNGHPSAGPIVAFSGRLETRKGVHVLAAAMRQVWRAYPAAQLVLVGGDYPYRGAKMSEHVLREAGESAGNVHILGDQPPQRLFPALAAADVVALPSLWEAFGIAALEAMALGKAVVLTTGSGYDDFGTDQRNALMVAPGEAPALAQAIVRLLGDSSLRGRLGEEARLTADRLDAPAVARSHVEYFAGLRGGRSRETP
jgi:glycosyltransferase involved in cell wall biosynthesis